MERGFEQIAPGLLFQERRYDPHLDNEAKWYVEFKYQDAEKEFTIEADRYSKTEGDGVTTYIFLESEYQGPVIRHYQNEGREPDQYWMTVRDLGGIHIRIRKQVFEKIIATIDECQKKWENNESQSSGGNTR